MDVDYEKLGELIDGGGIAPDDLNALPELLDTRDEEISLLRAENVRLREALTQVELILTSLRGTVVYTGDDQDDLLGGVTEGYEP